MTTSARVEQHSTMAGSCANYSELRGKSVLITGGASGIGLATAKAFAAQGAHLMLLDIDGEMLARTSADLQSANPDIGLETACGSTTDESAVEEAFARAEARFGRIDILFNNAGIPLNKPTLDISPSEWRHVVDVNLTGVFLCAQAAGRRMTRDRRGIIVNNASMFGLSAAPRRAGYCSTKAAVVALTKVLAVEWAPFDVRVNAVAPGYVRTSWVQASVQAGRYDLEALKKRTPLRRLAEPEEIAELVLFLASDRATFITGQALVADGGWTANGYM